MGDFDLIEAAATVRGYTDGASGLKPDATIPSEHRRTYMYSFLRGRSHARARCEADEDTLLPEWANEGDREERECSST